MIIQYFIQHDIQEFSVFTMHLTSNQLIFNHMATATVTQLV